MDIKHSTELLDFVGAIIVSVISGIISIARRVTAGHKASILWVISEFMMAIMSGYLMYTAYPHIRESMPAWFTLPIAVAFSAHVGGKVFQEVESALIRKYTSVIGIRPCDHR
jgi:tellurite resistance protein TehA-like permease